MTMLQYCNTLDENGANISTFQTDTLIYLVGVGIWGGCWVNSLGDNWCMVSWICWCNCRGNKFKTMIRLEFGIFFPSISFTCLNNGWGMVGSISDSWCVCYNSGSMSNDCWCSICSMSICVWSSVWSSVWSISWTNETCWGGSKADQWQHQLRSNKKKE